MLRKILIFMIVLNSLIFADFIKEKIDDGYTISENSEGKHYSLTARKGYGGISELKWSFPINFEYEAIEENYFNKFKIMMKLINHNEFDYEYFLMPAPRSFLLKKEYVKAYYKVSNQNEVKGLKRNGIKYKRVEYKRIKKAIRAHIIYNKYYEVLKSHGYEIVEISTEKHGYIKKDEIKKMGINYKGRVLMPYSLVFKIKKVK